MVSACDAEDTGDAGSIPGWERSPGGGPSNPLQCSCLKNPMDRGAWWPQSMGSQSWTEATEHAHIQYL